MKNISRKFALMLGATLALSPVAAEAHHWGGGFGPGYYGGGGWHRHGGGFGRGFVGGLVGGVVGGALLNSFSGGYGGGYYTAPRPYVYTPPGYGYGVYPPPVNITPQVTTTCTQTGYGTQICTQSAAPMVTYPGYGY